MTISLLHMPVADLDYVVALLCSIPSFLMPVVLCFVYLLLWKSLLGVVLHASLCRSVRLILLDSA
jgi:hypothetical protein